MAVDSVNMITIGDKAPAIEADTYFPKEDKIRRVKIPSGKKWQILTFYPGDFTFVCATDIEAFMAKYDKFKENGAEIYAISTDSVFSHKAWAQSSPRVKTSSIPMIEDFNKKAASAYGFLNEQSGAARRGVVIIDPNGAVQYMAVFNDGLGKDAEHIYTAFMGLKYMQDHPQKEGHMCAIPANWRVGKEALEIDVVKDIGKL